MSLEVLVVRLLPAAPDLAARRLYESLGFTNRAGGAGGPLMYVYERNLGDTSPG